MIKRPDGRVVRHSIGNGHDTAWIDFARFSNLLGVDEQRLKAGTWAGMSISAPTSGSYAIRRCLECWKNGYHCILFDIGAIHACPVHGCVLTEPCSSCTLQSTFSARSTSLGFGKRFCTRCRTMLPTRDQLVNGSPGVFDHTAMGGYCANFIAWWHAVGVSFSGRDALLRNLLCAGTTAPNETDFRSWLLHKAYEASTDVPLLWKFSLVAEPVQFATLDFSHTVCQQVERRNKDRGLRIRDIEARKYRSIRRYLFKTYVRQHSCCYKKLQSLTREQSLSLDGDKVCLASLAYFIWRMSIEGVVRLDALRTNRQKNFELRLMGPRTESRPSIDSSLRWSYFGFFGIWRSLRRLCGKKNLRVEKYGDRCEGHIYWKITESSGGVLRNKFAHGEDGVLLLYPRASTRIQVPASVCRKISSRKNSITVDRWYNIEEPFLWPSHQNLVRPRNILFQILHPSRETCSNRYAYIDV